MWRRRYKTLQTSESGAEALVGPYDGEIYGEGVACTPCRVAAARSAADQAELQSIDSSKGSKAAVGRSGSSLIVQVTPSKLATVATVATIFPRVEGVPATHWRHPATLRLEQNLRCCLLPVGSF